HSQADADAAEDEFNRRFVKKEAPDEIEEITLPSEVYRITDLVAASGLVASKAEAKRLIEQGGVKINGEKATSTAAEISLPAGESILLQVGKLKFIKLLGQS
ncbi:MAG: S4 domain-containing protein, partial [Blastocatellia bacterium]